MAAQPGRIASACERWGLLMSNFNVSTTYGSGSSGSYGGGSSAWDTFGSFDNKFQVGQVPPSSGKGGTAGGGGRLGGSPRSARAAG